MKKCETCFGQLLFLAGLFALAGHRSKQRLYAMMELISMDWNSTTKSRAQTPESKSDHKESSTPSGFTSTAVCKMAW